MPFVIAGHNEHVAWGFTALFADVQDLYVGKARKQRITRPPIRPGSRSTVDHEVVHVRGKADVTVDVRSTEHGPLINPDSRSMMGRTRAAPSP